MYITKDPEGARIAYGAGVDRIFVDLEYIGKAERQGGLDTVQNRHTPEDVRRIRASVPDVRILARVNPVHDASGAWGSSEEEIDEVIEAGADVVMLPFFKTAEEVRRFLAMLDGRAAASLLLETPGAVAELDGILALPGIDEIHIGLNDLSLGMGRRFLFELLADGTVEKLCRQIGGRGIPYGFGGIARPGGGALPAERIIREHCRLGSSCVILSRSFCNTALTTDPGEIESIFREGVREIRDVEKECGERLARMKRAETDAAGSGNPDAAYFEENRLALVRCVNEIIRQQEKKA